jgi:hypothetical protein
MKNYNFLSYRKFYIVVPVIILVSLGCENCTDEISIKEEKEIWKKTSLLSNDYGLMNSGFFDGSLCVLSPSVFYKNVFLKSDNYESLFRLEPYEGFGRFKFPVAKNFYVYSDANRVVVKSAFSSEINSVEKVINLKSIDPNFSHLIDVPYWQGECMAINDDFLLIPYKAVKNNWSVNTPYFVLVKINSSGGRDTDFKITSVDLINEDIFPGTIDVYRIQSFYNYFFVVMGAWTFRIDFEGNIHKISDKTLNIFKFNDSLFAFAPNINTGNVIFFNSTDHGETWFPLGEINQPLLSSLSYVSINDSIIGYTKGQIFQFKWKNDSYSISELDNEGLSLADITSVTLTNEHIVFITSRCNSFSNSCGGYYKSLENFFDRKE